MPESRDLTFGFSKSRTQMLLISAVRLVFLTTIVGIVVGFQTFQPLFLNLDVLLPVLIIGAASFFLSLLFLVFFDFAIAHRTTVACLFALDSLYITSLIYFSGVNQSIFLFLYLINILLCGLVFLRRGALILALWTSILFSLLLLIEGDIQGTSLFFSVGVNNLAFFAVAGLSGYLSEQLNFMGTELRERGRDLRALRNLNQLILQNTSTGMVTIDASGEVLQINPAGAELLDIDLGTALGRKIHAIWAELPKIIEAQRFLETDKKTAHVEVDHDAGFDRKMILALSISPLRNEESRVTGFVVTFQDMTKMKRLEAAMRHSEKLAAVGQLAAGIAHEIRNPLASISGSIQMLADSLQSENEDERKLMRITLREIDRLNNMITEFLDFVRPDQAKLEKLDLHRLLSEILDMVRVNGKLRQDVIQKIELRGSGWIMGDLNKLKQAFLNIVINAYQAMETSASAVLIVETFDHDNTLVLRIQDSGCGMNEKTLKRIFEPFLTTKPKGTGLGLAVTHKILETHSAQIFVDSHEGVGTEFTIEFPKLDSNRLQSGLEMLMNGKELADSTSQTDNQKRQA